MSLLLARQSTPATVTAGAAASALCFALAGGLSLGAANVTPLRAAAAINAGTSGGVTGTAIVLSAAPAAAIGSGHASALAGGALVGASAPAGALGSGQSGGLSWGAVVGAIAPAASTGSGGSSRAVAAIGARAPAAGFASGGSGAVRLYQTATITAGSPAAALGAGGHGNVPEPPPCIVISFLNPAFGRGAFLPEPDLARGLIGHWLGGNGRDVQQGKTLTDHSGRGHTGFLLDNHTRAIGPHPSLEGIQFAAPGGSLGLPLPSIATLSPPTGSGISCTAWFHQFTALTATVNRFGALGADPYVNLSLQIGSGELRWYFNRAGGLASVGVVVSPTVGFWHFSAFGWAGGSADHILTFYDGIFVDQGAPGGGYANDGSTFNELGGSHFFGESFGGLMGSTRLYDRGLSQGEFRAIYEIERQGLEESWEQALGRSFVSLLPAPPPPVVVLAGAPASAVSGGSTGSVVAPTPGVWTFIAARSNSEYYGIGSLTSPNDLDTSGANLLVAIVSAWTSSYTFSDSKGNTWTPLAQHTRGDGTTLQAFYCYGSSLNLGRGHTATVAEVADPVSGTSINGVILIAFAGCKRSSPFDQQVNHDHGGGGNNVVIGTITPSEPGELFICAGTGWGGALDYPPVGGWVMPGGEGGGQMDAPNRVGSAYKIVSDVTPQNPTLVSNGAGFYMSSMWAFKLEALVLEPYLYPGPYLRTGGTG